MLPWRRRRGRGFSSPRVKLLELAVAARYNASRLGLMAARLRRLYERTGDGAVEDMLRRVLTLQAILEVMAVRLETLAEIGAVGGGVLSVVRGVIRDARKLLGGLGPQVEGMLGELDNMVAEIAASTGVELDAPMPAGAGDAEVKRILEEARAVAEERLREILVPERG